MSKFTQNATYWGPDTRDSFNQWTFTAPTYIQVRWQDVNEKLFDQAIGQEVVAKGVIYTESASLITGGYLFKGISSKFTPRQVAGAYIIKRIDTTVSLRGGKTLYKIWL